MNKRGLQEGSFVRVFSENTENLRMSISELTATRYGGARDVEIFAAADCQALLIPLVVGRVKVNNLLLVDDQK